jgi:oxygen-independent coproporphyrinogen-3 oxidase
MLGLRLREGVSLADLEVRFGLSVWGIWEAEIAGLVEAGLLELSRGRLRLTDRGLLLASRVQAAFL